MPARKAPVLPVADASRSEEEVDAPSDSAAPNPQAGFEDLLGYQLRRAQKALYSHYSQELAEFRLTPGQIGLLFNIRSRPGISQAALAKERGIERATLGPIIDRFEQRGLVERRNSPYDRRSYALHLTTRGRKLLTTIWPKLVAHEEGFFSVLSSAEQRRLADYLKRIADSRQ